MRWGAAGVLLMLTLACCCWCGRDVPVEKPEGGVYPFEGGCKHTSMDAHMHVMRTKEPVELDALSDRLVIASCAPLPSARGVMLEFIFLFIRLYVQLFD